MNKYNFFPKLCVILKGPPFQQKPVGECKTLQNSRSLNEFQKFVLKNDRFFAKVLAKMPQKQLKVKSLKKLDTQFDGNIIKTNDSDTLF